MCEADKITPPPMTKLPALTVCTWLKGENRTKKKVLLATRK